ncbi:hypothetical protein BC826DRAFT_1033508 [Russula brevipes]|nr:hypothetical protein BC826DRAFT_1033508 [Russula brevipes]
MPRSAISVACWRPFFSTRPAKSRSRTVSKVCSNFQGNFRFSSSWMLWTSVRALDSHLRAKNC